MSGFDPRSLVEPEGGRASDFGTYRWFGIDPSVLYPAALDDLVARGHLGASDRALAITPRDDPSLYQGDRLLRRAMALELARTHFHARLIEQEGDGVGLHIRCEPAWRL